MKEKTQRRQPPIDPRLWRASQSARWYLVLSVVVGVFIACQLIVVAWCIARITAGIITTPTTRHLDSWTVELSILAVMIVLRAITGWVQDRYAHRTAGRVVLDLRLALLRAAARTNPRTLASRRDELRTIATSGLDGLPAYLISFIPAFMLAATVTPITWAAVTVADFTAGLIIAFTIPLIPIFMILVGRLTEERTRRHLNTMTTLSSTLLDLISGLPTLISVGREKGPARSVHEVGEKHFAATMASLRIAFLSGAVLELFATLSVALVAVSLGFRLRGDFGHVELFNAVFVLILVADVYKPLRKVGEKYHDAEDGQYAASRAFEAIALASAAEPSRLAEPVSVSSQTCLEVKDLTIASRGAYAPYRLSFTAEPGAITVLTGDNGVGKSTTLLALLNLPGMLPDASPDAASGSTVTGSITIDGHPLASIPQQDLWQRISWLPQRPALLAGTVADNLTVPTTSAASSTTIPWEKVERTAHDTGFDLVVEQLPDGYNTWLGGGGLGLSLGQRQRLALTRTLADDTQHVLLLDEPTAHLDGDAEERVLQRLRERADDGDTIVIIGHRDRLLAAADAVVVVERQEYTATASDCSSGEVAQ